MGSKIQPDFYYKSIFDVELEKLKIEGIEGIICDIDNTIVPWSKREIVKEVVNWFDEIESYGFKICLVSNGTGSRVTYFSEKLGVPAVGRAVKPAKRAFYRAMDKLGMDPEQIAVIGDQLFTDVFGGNRMGFTTVLVNPMSDRELFTTRLLRKLEKLFFERED
ncbi:YqeG family HAD IIIA-type phosphatase [Halothermothrix orenii]|uniref:HAD superfamily (Subfamily IIIA) phosphatase, TIGR01668 n=1 Tax=Halothermothrix orenii (strain H 168 / OCM 544 / DSM 9562) TaxID=373903 RepID=B8D2B7_HALOH|nr:YqeG family HAD IIIA-type phosphatase [Halothermothrix orenii]ACL69344.1 HAD superfamily (subfamily IIIA) phosphatase, TIGR01668 [Halothermothrix orenii H 168]